MTNATIFWDIFNCKIPSGVNGYEIVSAIRNLLLDLEIAPVNRFGFADLDILSKSLQLELQESGFHIIHSLATKSVELSILTEISKTIYFQKPPHSLVIICGDIDISKFIHFVTSVGYHVILIHAKELSKALKFSASHLIPWDNVLKSCDFIPINSNQDFILPETESFNLIPHTNYRIHSPPDNIYKNMPPGISLLDFQKPLENTVIDSSLLLFPSSINQKDIRSSKILGFSNPQNTSPALLKPIIHSENKNPENIHHNLPTSISEFTTDSKLGLENLCLKSKSYACFIPECLIPGLQELKSLQISPLDILSSQITEKFGFKSALHWAYAAESLQFIKFDKSTPAISLTESGISFMEKHFTLDTQLLQIFVSCLATVDLIYFELLKIAFNHAYLENSQVIIKESILSSFDYEKVTSLGFRSVEEYIHAAIANDVIKCKHLQDESRIFILELNSHQNETYPTEFTDSSLKSEFIVYKSSIRNAASDEISASKIDPLFDEREIFIPILKSIQNCGSNVSITSVPFNYAITMGFIDILHWICAAELYSLVTFCIKNGTFEISNNGKLLLEKYQNVPAQVIQARLAILDQYSDHFLIKILLSICELFEIPFKVKLDALLSALADHLDHIKFIGFSSVQAYVNDCLYKNIIIIHRDSDDQFLVYLVLPWKLINETSAESVALLNQDFSSKSFINLARFALVNLPNLSLDINEIARNLPKIHVAHGYKTLLAYIEKAERAKLLSILRKEKNKIFLNVNESVCKSIVTRYLNATNSFNELIDFLNCHDKSRPLLLTYISEKLKGVYQKYGFPNWLEYFKSAELAGILKLDIRIDHSIWVHISNFIRNYSNLCSMHKNTGQIENSNDEKIILKIGKRNNFTELIQFLEKRGAPIKLDVISSCMKIPLYSGFSDWVSYSKAAEKGGFIKLDLRGDSSCWISLPIQKKEIQSNNSSRHLSIQDIWNDEKSIQKLDYASILKSNDTCEKDEEIAIPYSEDTSKSTSNQYSKFIDFAKFLSRSPDSFNINILPLHLPDIHKIHGYSKLLDYAYAAEEFGLIRVERNQSSKILIYKNKEFLDLFLKDENPTLGNSIFGELITYLSTKDAHTWIDVTSISLALKGIPQLYGFSKWGSYIKKAEAHGIVVTKHIDRSTLFVKPGDAILNPGNVNYPNANTEDYLNRFKKIIKHLIRWDVANPLKLKDLEELFGAIAVQNGYIAFHEYLKALESLGVMKMKTSLNEIVILPIKGLCRRLLDKMEGIDEGSTRKTRTSLPAKIEIFRELLEFLKSQGFESNSNTILRQFPKIHQRYGYARFIEYVKAGESIGLLKLWIVKNQLFVKMMDEQMEGELSCNEDTLCSRIDDWNSSIDDELEIDLF